MKTTYMKPIQQSIVIITILILFSYNVVGQNNFKVGISMGSVIPLGEFKATDMKTLDAGFSETGFTLNFDGDYYLHHRLAVSARFHFGLSSIDQSNVYDWLKGEMANYFVDDTLSTSNIGYWQWSAPLLGFKYNYPIIINKLYLETGLFTGLNICPIPYQSISIDDLDNERKYYSDNKPGTSLSVPIMIDGAFRLVLGENIQIKLQTSYYQTNINYKHKNSFQNINTAVIDINEFEVNVPLKHISVSLGIIYTI